MTAKRLIAAFNFPPYNDASAVTMAKRIVMMDEQVDVVSMNLKRIRERDESLYELIRPYLGMHSTVDGKVKFTDWSSITAFAEAGELATHRHLRRYESVYSRSMWPHSHFLAALLKSINPELRWTAEFSDPPLWTVDGRSRSSGTVGADVISARILAGQSEQIQRFLKMHDRVLDWTHLVPCLSADAVVFTNEQQRDLMLTDIPEEWREMVTAKAIISPHPTLPSSYYGPRQRVDDGSLRIGYFGTFYPNRGAGEFLEAWASLHEEEARAIRLDVYASETRLLERAALHLGLSQQVTIRKPIPFLKFLPQTTQYDALLVNDTSTSPFAVASPFLPSKVADYRGSSTPIIALTIPGSPLDQIPAKWKATIGNISSIRVALTEALNHVRISS